MAARLRRIAQQPPHLFERSRRWEIHSAHDRAIRLVALLAHFDQFLLEVRYRYGFRGAHKKIANGRAIRAKAAENARAQRLLESKADSDLRRCAKESVTVDEVLGTLPE